MFRIVGGLFYDQELAIVIHVLDVDFFMHQYTFF